MRISDWSSDVCSSDLSEPAVVFAHPNLIAVVVYRQFIPNDPLFANQWHHSNTGQAGGTVDADADTDFAWALNQGNAAITIAVLDSGFDIAHEDLQPNLVNGYNFNGCTAMTGPADRKSKRLNS